MRRYYRLKCFNHRDAGYCEFEREIGIEGSD